MKCLISDRFIYFIIEFVCSVFQNLHRTFTEPARSADSIVQTEFLNLSQTFQSLRVLVLLEHGGLDVLAEEGSKVKVFGHQLLLHVLQRPLVFHDLQRLPLTLTHTNKQTNGDVSPNTEYKPVHL